jgi:hypothetical protein
MRLGKSKIIERQQGFGRPLSGSCQIDDCVPFFRNPRAGLLSRGSRAADRLISPKIQRLLAEGLFCTTPIPGRARRSQSEARFVDLYLRHEQRSIKVRATRTLHGSLPDPDRAPGYST